METVYLSCSCGWTHTTTTPTTAWKKWHRKQHTPKGSRPSESGHIVVVKREKK